MRKITFIAILLSFYALLLPAQDRLVLANGDTLSGEIDILYPDKYYEEIVFKTGDDKKRMKAYEFVGFIKENEIYKTVKNNDKYQIMRLVKDGYLGIYNYRMESDYNFAGMYLLRADGFGTDVPTISFRKAMSRFLEDCNAVSSDIKDGVYKRNEIEDLVDAYNNCIERNTLEMERARGNKPAVADSGDPLLREINSLVSDSRSQNNEELTSILSDIEDKVREGEDIPTYLKKALESEVGEDHPLHSRVVEFLKKV